MKQQKKGQNGQHLNMMGRLSLQQIILVLVSIFSLSCKRENLDYTFDYRPNPDAEKASNARLVNLSENAQLIANGDSLTNFFIPPNRIGYIPPEELTPPGTRYFPKDGRLGQSWTVPQDLFQTDGTVRFRTTFVPIPNKTIASHDVEFTVRDSYSAPKDYYLLINHESRVQRPDKLVEVPRSVTAPARPDHFKIRIINFAKKLMPTSSMEDITGPITLAYADGTPVSKVTTKIESDAWSDYVELPYGTYQFKLLTADGRQIPAVGHTYYNNIDRFNSTMEMGGGAIPRMSSGQTYAPVQTFQPGGIYTIVVHPKEFTWTTGTDDIRELQNGFQIIADISEPLNRTYAQLQLANTIVGQNALLTAKGQKTAATAYGAASDYIRIVAGQQHIVLETGSGQALASLDAELQAGQNYTAWLYTDQDKKVKVLLAANNLAGTGYTGKEGGGNNATIDRFRSSYMFNFRFLNFCAALPYATFTNGEGRPFGTGAMNSGVNMAPGVLNILQSYTSLLYSASNDVGGPYQFMAYSSLPTRIPGDWLEQVKPLSSTQLVANPTLYTAVGRRVPLHEPGVYSIAVIGDLKSTSETDKAKFMVVKHTK
ncbi:MAG: DUF4397 domain-containing protein [Sphingobacterium sp.]|jgi:hypothetical protein|uniref:hypothetical protein n=1 Tax=Sphingobacterium sp. TaxID=341027 RepID=UPI00285064D3|nr:hypothetical protein [Sphingobacterium sp.]MDR3008141.1 DUF4397 domain-containing protein [Sphingobacterium sp.]